MAYKSIAARAEWDEAEWDEKPSPRFHGHSYMNGSGQKLTDPPINSTQPCGPY
jgi:hypothetical protein